MTTKVSLTNWQLHGGHIRRWTIDHRVPGLNLPGTFSLNVQFKYVFSDSAKKFQVREESLPSVIIIQDHLTMLQVKMAAILNPMCMS